MDENKPKEGVSIKEMETFAKKHRFEVFFCLAFILACIFTFVMWGPGWSIIAAAVGAILGIFLRGKVNYFSKAVYGFIFKHEQVTQLVLGIIALILAIFLPPLFFLLLGLHGGKDMHHWAMEIYSQQNR
jgi:hypothetical protein